MRAPEYKQKKNTSAMTRLTRLIAAMLLIVLSSALAAASEVGDALKQIKTISGKPDTSAICYVYLDSASWCGPCRAEMPKIVKEYKKMKKKGIEIILCSADKTEKDAKNYVKNFKIKFPVIMGSNAKLPGYQRAGGIPHATFVDAKGNKLESGHGSIIVSKWREVLDRISADDSEDKADEPEE